MGRRADPGSGGLTAPSSTLAGPPGRQLDASSPSTRRVATPGAASTRERRGLTSTSYESPVPPSTPSPQRSATTVCFDRVDPVGSRSRLSRKQVLLKPMGIPRICWTSLGTFAELSAEVRCSREPRPRVGAPYNALASEPLLVFVNTLSYIGYGTPPGPEHSAGRCRRFLRFCKCSDRSVSVERQANTGRAGVGPPYTPLTGSSGTGSWRHRLSHCERASCGFLPATATHGTRIA